MLRSVYASIKLVTEDPLVVVVWYTSRPKRLAAPAETILIEQLLAQVPALTAFTVNTGLDATTTVTVAVAVAPVTAVPVAALVTVNCELERVAIVTLVRLNADVERPVIDTVCPTANVFVAVYVTVPLAADAAVTVAVVVVVVPVPSLIITEPATDPVPITRFTYRPRPPLAKKL
jgi:hypothetical protein